MFEMNQLKELMRQHDAQKKEINYNNPIALAKLTSDPIFGTIGEPGEHKHGSGGRKIIAYPDPDEQGLDEDIKTTQQNLQSSQVYWGHTWDYDLSKNMPNFAIPGKPEYDGEKRTNLQTFGKWHIPFYTDEAVASSALSGAQVNHPKNVAPPTVTKSVVKTVAPAPAKVQIAQAAKPVPVAPRVASPVAAPSLAHTAQTHQNATNGTVQAAQHTVQVESRTQIREKLTAQIAQLQQEIQNIWKLQQEKENTLHQLQQELIKASDPSQKKED